MSSETYAWAKEQRCGDPVTKAVLMEIANWAKPNGVCDFLPLARLADVVEVSTRTVQRHLDRLENPDGTRGGLGLIRRVHHYREDGGRWANGFELVGYQPPLSAAPPPLRTPRDNLSPPPDNLAPAPVTPASPPPDNRVTGPVTMVSPHKEKNITTPSPPIGGDAPPGEFERDRDDDPLPKRALALPEDWQPPPLEALPAKAAELVRQWPPGALAASCETFRLHWRGVSGRRGRKTDWTGELAKWLLGDHSKIMRAAQAGVTFGEPAGRGRQRGPSGPPVTAKRLEDAASAKLHEAVRRQVGPLLHDTWLKPAALLVGPDAVTVVAKSHFAAGFIEERLGAALAVAARGAFAGEARPLRYQAEGAGR